MRGNCKATHFSHWIKRLCWGSTQAVGLFLLIKRKGVWLTNELWVSQPSRIGVSLPRLQGRWVSHQPWGAYGLMLSPAFLQENKGSLICFCQSWGIKMEDYCTKRNKWKWIFDDCLVIDDLVELFWFLNLQAKRMGWDLILHLSYTSDLTFTWPQMTSDLTWL